MNIHTLTSEVGTNPITIETGKLAKLADGAVTVRCGDTIILVTAVSYTKVKPGQTWFPLSVEYKEKASAAGVFRSGRPLLFLYRQKTGSRLTLSATRKTA